MRTVDIDISNKNSIPEILYAYIGSRVCLRPVNYDGDDISFTSSDDEVAVANDKGEVTPRQRGIANITIRCGGKSVMVKLAVMVAHLSHRKLSLFEGCSQRLSLLGKTAISWSSTDESVATVDKNGVVSATGEGSCKIICTSKSLKKYNCYITVRSKASTASINASMIGDVLTHYKINRSCKNDDGSYDHKCLFRNIRDEVQGEDIAIVNQEVVIGGEELGTVFPLNESPDGYPRFNLPYEMGDTLADTGFNVVCHATNHVLDIGDKAIQNCVRFWKSSHPEVKALGIYTDKSDYEDIYVYEKDGIRIAIINFTYGTNHKTSEYPYSIALMKKKYVEQQITRANEIADFVIVAPHWGKQYELEETDIQRGWAMRFLEYGADLVLGTHPHVIEPIKTISDNGTRECLYITRSEIL